MSAAGTVLETPPDRVATAVERLAPVRELYPFTPRFLEHEGTAQHYVDEGPRDAPVLLALHGNPTWSFLWRDVILRLRGRYRVVAPDHVGCGLSDKPEDYPYTLARHAENAARLVRELDLRDVTLVLHDWGGAIGMGLARRLPGRIARLVILNSAAFASRRVPARIRLCRAPLLGGFAVRRLNAFVRAATFMACERPLPAVVKRGYLLPHPDYASRVATHAFVRDIPLSAGHPSWEELAAIEAALPAFADRPALLLWGERDWCFTPEFRHGWKRRLPAAEERVFADAGHLVLEDAGAPALDALADFLARTDAS